MKAAMVSRRNVTSTANVFVDRCQFVGNERAMTLVGPFRSAAIYRSTFVANRAIHAGAGILVLVTKNTDVLVDNCTFVDNAAGQYRDFYAVGESKGTVRFVGDEVHLNTACCKGVVMMVGKGGAMRIQRGNVTLLRSAFVNNSARLLGGSVFVDIDCKLNMSGSSFENSPMSRSTHALQGDIIYSDGRLSIDDVSMVVRSASNGLSVFRHSGDHWSLRITNVWVQCPVGYDLRTTNSSAYGVAPDGLRRSYQLDQLSYYCESCPRNKYSLDHGYLNYTITSRDPAYFALLINGSTPRTAYKGKFVHHKITCADCPHGGQCVHGITPVHNFWGYVVSNASVVRFQHCPKGYCRSAGDNLRIDSCTERREGRLCGRCQPGYSEAWFSTLCVPNEVCGPVWLYVLTTTLGVLYAIFLMFQADVKKFIFSGPLCTRCRSEPKNAQSTLPADRQNNVPSSSSSLMMSLRRRQDRATQRIELTKFDDYTPPTIYSHFDHHASAPPTDDDEPTNNGMLLLPVTSSNAIDFRCHTSDKMTQKRDGATAAATTSSDREQQVEVSIAVDYGCIVILVYYLQDSQLLNVKTVYTVPSTQLQFIARSIIAVLFRFELDVFELLHETCAIPDMTPVPKLASQAMLVPFVMAVFVVIHTAGRILRWLGCRDRTTSGSQRSGVTDSGSLSTLDVKLASGFITTLLFMYQKMGTTTFVVLNCVPVDNVSVLFVDGTVTCYTHWHTT